MTDVVSGIRTFLKSRISKNIPDAETILIRGYPYDLGTTNRPGARFGPAAIRDASLMLADGPDVSNWRDAGDLPLAGKIFDVNQSLDLIHNDATFFIRSGCKLLSIGGDHTITKSIFEAHFYTQYKRHGLSMKDIGLVMFDAHSDTWGTDNVDNHGTWVKTLIKRKLLNPQNVYMFGVRSPMPADERNWFENTIPSENIFRPYGPFDIEKMLAKLWDIPYYCTFDIDCLDPSVAPGTGTPEIGGMYIKDIQSIISALPGETLIGADLVEVSPAYDISGQTALAGATILWWLGELMNKK